MLADAGVILFHGIYFMVESHLCTGSRCIRRVLLKFCPLQTRNANPKKGHIGDGRKQGNSIQVRFLPPKKILHCNIKTPLC